MSALPPEQIDVIRTHLELRNLGALRRSTPPSGSASVTREQLTAQAYRALYLLVGERWQWRDRLRLSDEELDSYLARSDVHVWVLRVDERIAGYFELQRQGTQVEIMYFGLAPEFVGRGLGGWLLGRAAEEAFALGATRITLHTCTLDSANALPNYLARGFVIVREERYAHTLDSAAVRSQ